MKDEDEDEADEGGLEQEHSPSGWKGRLMNECNPAAQRHGGHVTHVWSFGAQTRELTLAQHQVDRYQQYRGPIQKAHLLLDTESLELVAAACWRHAGAQERQVGGGRALWWRRLERGRVSSC